MLCCPLLITQLKSTAYKYEVKLVHGQNYLWAIGLRTGDNNPYYWPLSRDIKCSNSPTSDTFWRKSYTFGVDKKWRQHFAFPQHSKTTTVPFHTLKIKIQNDVAKSPLDKRCIFSSVACKTLSALYPGFNVINKFQHN